MQHKLSQSTWHILLASFLPGMGKSSLWRLVSQPEFARATDPKALAEVFPELAGILPGAPGYEVVARRAGRQVELAEKYQAEIIGYWDRTYPGAFRTAPLSPAILWFKGARNCLDAPAVAVIGTRHPTSAGEVSAARIAEGMAKRGLTIISGLALGVDVIAHKATLAAGGKTIAILAGGLDRISPKANLDIAEAISASEGGLLSEFPLESPTFSSNFVVRDATQAAISAAVILIQSDRNGGSMHASRAILKLGRKLIVAAPLPVDIVNCEQKIDANLLFYNEGYDNLVRNQGFPPNAKGLIRLLTGRGDYDRVADEIRSDWASIIPRRMG